MNLQKIEHAIKVICDQGCARIRSLIQVLETSGSIPETEELSWAENQAVLAELKSIMAIYDTRS